MGSSERRVWINRLTHQLMSSSAALIQMTHFIEAAAGHEEKLEPETMQILCGGEGLLAQRVPEPRGDRAPRIGASYGR